MKPEEADDAADLSSARTTSPAAAALVAEHYHDLRRIAHARLFGAGHITLLQTADVVQEVYLRLAKAGGLHTGDRGRFLAYAARVVRSVIVDFVRERGALRRGGDAERITLDTQVEAQVLGEEQILGIDTALEELRALDAPLAEIVEMRFFAGMSEVEIAGAMGVSERTVRRQWEKARRLLSTILADD